MAAAPPSTPRASLLSGLRTGGVRSTSMNVPHTASVTGSFNVPRFSSSNYQYSPFMEEEEMDQVGDILSQNMQNMYINSNSYNSRPMTAAVDGPNNRFAQQQQHQQQQQQHYQGSQRPLNPNSVPFNPSFSNNTRPSAVDVQAQAYQQQMQLMQLEIMRLQSAQVQAQRNQAAMMAEQLLRQQMNMDMNTQANQNRRSSASFNPPATAGPLNTAFDLRNIANNAQSRRASQADMLKLQLGLSSSPPPPVYEDPVPMTAALNGRFGGRQSSAGFDLPREDFEPFPQSSSPPRQINTLSGGTTVGNSNGNPNSIAPSKSDAAASWRRGPSPPGRSMSMNGTPSLRITPPPNDPVSPPGLPSAGGRTRPRPLSFAAVAPTQDIPVIVTIDTDEETSSTSSSQSNPTTPNSNSSLDAPPLSPREEVSKKLYEGLGLGRAGPPSTHTINVPSMVNATVNQRLALSGQPVRQPRGPPSGADELGPKNFATRIRRKAIGGLGVLMGARERRGSLVEAQ